MVQRLNPAYITTTTVYTGSTTSTSTQLATGTVQGTVYIYTPLPTLSCDPFGYLVQAMILYRVNITTGTTTQVKTGVGDGSRNIQAIGYNVADNFIYGSIGTTVNNPVDLIRIAGDGSSTILKSLNISSSWYPNSGDVDENSFYWASYRGQQWLQLDLRPSSPTFGTTLTGGTASPTHVILDWAYVPGGGNYLYSLGYDTTSLGTVLTGTHTYLQRFDRTAKTWEVLADLGVLAGQQTWGAVYASDDGYLFGSENTSGRCRETRCVSAVVAQSAKYEDKSLIYPYNIDSGKIYRFNIPPNGNTTGFTPSAVSIAAGPVASSNDGARCIKAKF
ncbi:hypothetical protein TruAng_008004 [Truncatella angustata]|nr:hypothetical protein TruAng_008004 [Truncatella angustata]